MYAEYTQLQLTSLHYNLVLNYLLLFSFLFFAINLKELISQLSERVTKIQGSFFADFGKYMIFRDKNIFFLSKIYEKGLSNLLPFHGSGLLKNI